MTTDDLLQEVRKVLAGPRRARTAAAQAKRLGALANHPPATRQLLRALESRELLEAHVAATALRFATGELVRRRVVATVGRLEGERHLLARVALLEDELAKLRLGLPEAVATVVYGRFLNFGLTALNDPALFIERFCDGRPSIDASVVGVVEKVRRSFGLGPTGLYGPLLQRALTPEAREQALGILGRLPGDRVQALLEAEQARASTDEAQRVARRERMRQASLTEPVPPRPGVAYLSPLGPIDAVLVEIFEQPEEARPLRTNIALRFDGTFVAAAEPLEDAPKAIARRADDADWTRLSLGQARALLETMATKGRERLAPLLERLEGVAIEPLPVPVPTALLAPDEAWALLDHPLLAAWMPISSLHWPRSLLAASAHAAWDHFPLHLDQTAQVAQDLLGTHLARPPRADALAIGLRLLALAFHVRGDPRAAALAAEALVVARHRPAPVAMALAQKHLITQLYHHAEMPRDYSREVRDHLRNRLAPTEASWEDVQRLDLAQGAAEGLAREACRTSKAPVLPPPESLDFEAALRFGDKAREGLAKPAFRRRVASGREEATAEPLRGWLELGTPEAVIGTMRIAGRHCLDVCPFRCFERLPQAPPAEVWASETVPGGDGDGVEARD